MCMLVHVRVCRNEEEHLLHLGPLAGAQQDGSGACGALTVFSLLANFQSSTTPLPPHVVSCIWGCVCSAVVVAKKKKECSSKNGSMVGGCHGFYSFDRPTKLF